MADGIKNYPPSELKLQRLREQGVFPRSAVALAAAVVLGTFVAFHLSSRLLSPALKDFAIRSFNGSVGANELVIEAWSVTFLAIVCCLLPMLSITLLLGLLQSRFFFRFSQASIDLSRISQGLSNLGISVSAILSLLLLSSMAMIYFYIAYSLLMESAQEFFQQLLMQGHNSGVLGLPKRVGGSLSRLQELIDSGFGLFNQLWLISLFFCLILGLSCYLVRWFVFRREQMMSRSELEAEFREQEASPEMSESLRERQLN
jgi:flagellar biosynthesis protein FlhB